MVTLKKTEMTTTTTTTTTRIRRKMKSPLPRLCFIWICLALMYTLYATTFRKNQQNEDIPLADRSSATASKAKVILRKEFPPSHVCPINSIASLSPSQLEPEADDRYMVTPPKGGKVHLLCCDSTKGQFNILLHEKWAPRGVAHLLEMFEGGYFSTSRLPLYRCTDACQFGLSGNTNMTKKFHKPIQDDPQWLPGGPNHRQNSKGVRRYPKGFFTHAGGGNNTRSNQFVITLKPNLFMGGGSPWEVPMGELVGQHSFDTIDLWYNGYGEKGPGQGLLNREGDSENVRTKWPLMDYILGCNLVDQMVLPQS